MKNKRFIKLGKGIIDCSVSDSGTIVAGDINGGVFVTDLYGKIKQKWDVGMPVWGVDICNKGEYVAIAAADKVNGKGALFIYKNNIRIFSYKNISEAWDIVIHNSKDFYFSTWKDGLFHFDLRTKLIKQIRFEENLFGLTKDNNFLYITIAGKGIQAISLMDQSLKTLKKSSIVCFNNFFDNKESLYSGSNRNFLLHFRKNDVKKYSIGKNQICSVCVLGEYVLVGDLGGYFFVLKKEKLDTPIFTHLFKGGIWNIATKGNRVIIACGDGNLYLLSFDEIIAEIESYEDRFRQSESIAKLLKGTKIFLSYSRKDKDRVNTIYRNLKEIGCDPWMDIYSILPGQDWKLEVRKIIQDCQFVMMFLSKNSTTRKGYFQKEIKEAFEEFKLVPRNQIFLIPVKIDECEIPQEISRLQFVDLLSKDSFEKILMAMCHQTLKHKN